MESESLVYERRETGRACQTRLTRLCLLAGTITRLLVATKQLLEGALALVQLERVLS